MDADGCVDEVGFASDRLGHDHSHPAARTSKMSFFRRSSSDGHWATALSEVKRFAMLNSVVEGS
jgi:hypothetical protein